MKVRPDENAVNLLSPDQEILEKHKCFTLKNTSKYNFQTEDKANQQKNKKHEIISLE